MNIEDGALAELATRFNAVRDDVMGLKRDYAGFVATATAMNSTMDRLATRIDQLAERFEEAKRPNWMLFIGMISLAGSLCVGFWVVLKLEIGAEVQPVIQTSSNADAAQKVHASEISAINVQIAEIINKQVANIPQIIANTATIKGIQELQVRQGESILGSAQADVNSRTDRAQLNDRMRSMEAAFAIGLSERKAAIAEISARLLEVETQFKGQSNLVNLAMANQRQWNALLFEQINPGKHFPESNFFPEMFQPSPQPIGK